jgi:hypothetical protein
MALLLLFIIRGYKRGFFKGVASTMGIVLAVFLTGLIYPYINIMLCDYTGIDETVKATIEKKLDIEDNVASMTRNQEMQFIDNLMLPDTVKTQLLENSNADTYIEIGAKDFKDFIVLYLSSIVMKGISYLITYIIIKTIIIIILALSDILNYIPIVNGINKVGGGAFGFCQGILVIWIFMGLVTVFSVFSWASSLMQMIDESIILSAIYKNNIFLKILVDIMNII